MKLMKPILVIVFVVLAFLMLGGVLWSFNQRAFLSQIEDDQIASVSVTSKKRGDPPPWTILAGEQTETLEQLLRSLGSRWERYRGKLSLAVSRELAIEWSSGRKLCIGFGGHLLVADGHSVELNEEEVNLFLRSTASP